MRNAVDDDDKLFSTASQRLSPPAESQRRIEFSTVSPARPSVWALPLTDQMQGRGGVTSVVQGQGLQPRREKSDSCMLWNYAPAAASSIWTHQALSVPHLARASPRIFQAPFEHLSGSAFGSGGGLHGNGMTA